MGNVSNINHLIHFILGMLSQYYNYIVVLFLIYQIIDGYKFNYKAVRNGKYTDDIPLDLLFFALGALTVRYF